MSESWRIAIVLASSVSRSSTLVSPANAPTARLTVLERRVLLSLLVDNYPSASSDGVLTVRQPPRFTPLTINLNLKLVGFIGKFVGILFKVLKLLFPLDRSEWVPMTVTYVLAFLDQLE